MRQLPLDVQLADYAVFESFYLGSNAAAVHALGLVAAGEGSPVMGPERLRQIASAAGLCW